MNKSLRRRVAAVATTATVGGLLLPFLAAGSAFALIAGPDRLAVSPSNAATNAGTTAKFVVSQITNPGTGDVYSQGLTGPDANVPPNKCTPTIGATTYDCNFTTGTVPGIDTVRFFYDVNGSGAYQANDPVTTANLTVAGPINQIVLTPAASSVASSDYKKFNLAATDAAGRPVITTAGQFNIKASETTTRPADLFLTTTQPGLPYVTGLVGAGTGIATKNQVSAASDDGTLGTLAGVSSFYVASRNPGTVNLTVTTFGNPAISASGVLTVNAGTANDVTAVTVVPTAQRAFTGDTVTAVVNLRNTQGDPVAGIAPKIAFTGGPNVLQGITTTGGGFSDGDGNITVTYTALAGAAKTGTDTLEAYVDQNKPGQASTGSLDAGEPFFDASIVLVQNDLTSIANDGGANGFTVPLNVKATTVTYQVKTTGNTLAGYNLVFTTSNPRFTLSATSAVTDATGKASVTVTNKNPSDTDTTNVIAKIGSGAAPGVSSAAVTYSANAVSRNSVKITPFANTASAGGTASFTATATDSFGNSIAGVNFAWTVTGRNSGSNNSGATGNGPVFSYSDKGSVNASGQDVVTVQTTGGTIGANAANQYWVTTAARATQANIDLVGQDGFYTQNNAGLPAGTNGPIQPSNFDTRASTNVSPDPTAIKPAATGVPLAVVVGLTDQANNRLYGKTVTFSSSGAGVFTDFQGNPLGTSATALVADSDAAAQDFNYKGLPNGSVDKYATVYVRSTVPGKQLITATVDGISTNATVTYGGQYVSLTPTRVMDTRTGQGAVSTAPGGSAAPAGPLAPNTSYYFNYAASGMPIGTAGAPYAAYAFNITAINPSGVGNLRVAPGTGAAATAPTTSLVNYQPGSDVANFVIVPNTADALQLFSAASTANVAVDLVGYYPTVASITAVAPTRIVDTRTAGGGGAVAANTSRPFQVGGTPPIPGTGTVKAVALNVTAVNPGGLGNLRIYADGALLPTTSNINYIPGQDKSAFVIVNLPTNGQIRVYSAGTPVDVAIDAYAFFDKTSTLVTQTPVRSLDTRTTSPLPAAHYLDLPVAGVGGVPADASAVLVSVTGIHTTGSTGVGNLRVYPSGGTLPDVSTLNYVSPTTDVANFAIVKVGANGSIAIDSEGSPIDVAVDVVGYVPAGS